jgi:CubicO group peptidase (beta-lactamase class C family)
VLPPAPPTALNVPAAAPARLEAKVDELFGSLVREKKAIGLVVGVVTPSGEAVFGYGETRRGSRERPDRNSVFEIGSMTKVFTSLALAREVVQGQLRLDDPVEDLLGPGWTVPSFDGQKILLKHLASHTSGLPRLPTNFKPADPKHPYADYGESQLREYLATAALSRAPGSAYDYSNLGMGLLGFALARKAGLPFATYLYRTVLDPMGLGFTTVRSDVSRMTQGYLDGEAVDPFEMTDVFAGAGVLKSTVSDLLAFLEAASGSKPSDFSGAFQLAERPFVDEAGGGKVGLGWHVHDRHGIHFVWHNGSTYGASSMLLFDPETKIGVVALANSGTLNLSKPSAELLRSLEEGGQR